MDAEITAFIAIAGALATVLVAVINGVITRRKTGAETVEVLVRSAGGLAERLAAENERQVRDLKAVRDRVQLVEEKLEVEEEERRIEQSRWERERTMWRHTLQNHAYWDMQALQQLKDKGVTLPDPPPLLPPVRATDYPSTQVDYPRELT